MSKGLAQRFDISSVIAESDALKALCETTKRLAQFSTTVLIQGESGTGKELFARKIHFHSERADKPFVAINCGAIPEQLIESELFGYRKGAFTSATQDKIGLFEAAQGGTIFLDEIAELPLALQTKILRALQEHQIQPVGSTQLINLDVRIITATHQNLEIAVREKRFREDLYYRLNVVTMTIPPLRERPEDIPALVHAILKKQHTKHKIANLRFDDQAFDYLLHYSWPGNVRELENCVERAVVLAHGNTLGVDSLPKALIDERGSLDQRVERIKIPLDDLSIKKRTQNLEIDLIAKAIKKTRGNHTRAAKLLEISHRALLYKLKEYGFSSSSRVRK